MQLGSARHSDTEGSGLETVGAPAYKKWRPFLIAPKVTGDHNHRRCEIPIWSFSLCAGSDSADRRSLCGFAGHCLGRHGGQLLQGRRRWNRDLKDFRWEASLRPLSQHCQKQANRKEAKLAVSRCQDILDRPRSALHTAASALLLVFKDPNRFTV